MKNKYRFIRISVLFLFLLNIGHTHATPNRTFQLNEKSPWTEMSRKQMEQQLGRKMNLKERTAFWLAKKKAKAKEKFTGSEILFLILLSVLFFLLLIVTLTMSKEEATSALEPMTYILLLVAGVIYNIGSGPKRRKKAKEK